MQIVIFFQIYWQEEFIKWLVVHFLTVFIPGINVFIPETAGFHCSENIKQVFRTISSLIKYVTDIE